MARLRRGLFLAFGGWACVHLLLVVGWSSSTDFEAFAVTLKGRPPYGAIAESVELVKPGFSGDVTSNERLPVTEILSWPHWVAMPNMNPKAKLKAIPSPSSHPHLAEEGWVTPSGFDQLWLPEGLPPPVAKVGISGIFKDGHLLYVAPALDLSISAANRTWRNRGQNSVILARQWIWETKLHKLFGPKMTLTGHVQKGKSWVKIFDGGLDVGEAWRKLKVDLLFQKSGYHIVTLPISGPVLQDELKLGHKESFRMTLRLSESDAGEDQEKTMLDQASLSVKVRSVENQYTKDYLSKHGPEDCKHIPRSEPNEQRRLLQGFCNLERPTAPYSSAGCCSGC